MSTQEQPSAAVGTGQSIWEDARSLLSEDVAEIFELDRTEKKDCNQLLEEILKITDRKKTEFIERGTKFSFRGKTIVVRDVLSKLVVWIDRFKAFGDTATQIDTLHAALPWVAVRFLLDAAVRDERTYSSTLAGVARIAKIYTLTFIIERLYLSMHSDIIKHLRQSLVELYAEMLLLLSKSVRYFNSGKIKRAVKGIFTAEDIEDSFDSLEAKQKEVERIRVLAEADRVQAMSSVTQEIHAQQEQLKSKLEEFAKPVSKIEAQVIDIYNYVDEERQVKILDSISKILHNSHHDFAAKGRLPGSGEWLFEKPEFQSWQEATSSSIIWLRGDPGAGKTKLASLVVDELRTKEELGNEREPRNERFAFFYCNRNPAQPERAHAEPILASLVRQLACVAEGVIFDTIRSRYSKILQNGTYRDVTWPIEKSVHALIGLTGLHTSTVLVLDALDEVEPSEIATLLAALLHVKRDSAGAVKIFFSSRQNERIKNLLQDHPNFCIEAHDNAQDIEAFVHKNLESFTLLKKLPDLRKRALSTLMDGAQGMFRWVELQIQMLQELQDPEDFEDRLGNLPELLEDLYLEIYSKIQKSSNKNAAKFATRTFQWLLVAKMQLNLEQFAIFASIDSKNPGFYTADYFLEICQNLISRDEDGMFRFAHLSVREFLEHSIPKRGIEDFLSPQANACIASLCLDTLLQAGRCEPKSCQGLSDDHTDAPLGNIKDTLMEVRDDEADTPLYYASSEWADHINECRGMLSDPLKSQIMDFMFDPMGISPWFKSWAKLSDPPSPISPNSFGEITLRACFAKHPIWLLDAFGLIECSGNRMPKIDDDQHRIVLETAMRSGNLSMMEKMLQTGIYLDCTSHGLPSTTAAQESSTAPQIVSCRAAVDEESLIQAVHDFRDSFTSIEKRLIQFFHLLQDVSFMNILVLLNEGTGPRPSKRGARLKFRNSFTSIQADMGRVLEILHRHDPDAGQKIPVKDLIQLSLGYAREHTTNDFHDGLQQSLRGLSLTFAVEFGSLDMVEALLNQGAQPDLRIGSGNTPLHYVRDFKIAKILLEHGAQVNAQDNSSRTPIFGTKKYEVMKLLLDHGAQVHHRDDSLETPLHAAVRQSKPRVVRLLLERGAEIDARGDCSNTPLHVAVGSRKFAVVQTLLESGAQVSVTNDSLETPLHIASDGPLEIFKILLVYGADPEAMDKDGKTPADIILRWRNGVKKYLADFKNLPADQRPKRSDYSLLTSDAEDTSSDDTSESDFFDDFPSSEDSDGEDSK